MKKDAPEIVPQFWEDVFSQIVRTIQKSKRSCSAEVYKVESVVFVCSAFSRVEQEYFCPGRVRHLLAAMQTSHIQYCSRPVFKKHWKCNVPAEK